MKLSLTKFLILAGALLAAICFAACKNDSVVSNGVAGQGQTAATNATPAAPNNPAAAQSPVAAPAASPTSPVGPTGQTTPTSPFEPQPGEKKQMMGNIPVTVSPAKPSLTPAPDPFPPRPTPTIVMENGKIVQQWKAPADAASLTNPVKDRPDAAQLGREFYMQKCGDCHGKEGKGNGWMSKMVARPPTNLASRMVQANTDGELFWKITNGKSPMPAHRVRFDDEQRWLIVSFLRTLKP